MKAGLYDTENDMIIAFTRDMRTIIRPPSYLNSYLYYHTQPRFRKPFPHPEALVGNLVLQNLPRSLPGRWAVPPTSGCQ